MKNKVIKHANYSPLKGRLESVDLYWIWYTCIIRDRFFASSRSMVYILSCCHYMCRARSWTWSLWDPSNSKYSMILLSSPVWGIYFSVISQEVVKCVWQTVPDTFVHCHQLAARKHLLQTLADYCHKTASFCCALVWSDQQKCADELHRYSKKIWEILAGQRLIWTE